MSTRKLPPPRDGLQRDVKHLMNVKRGKELHAFRKRHMEPVYRLARVLCTSEAAAQDLTVGALDTAMERSGTWPRDERLDAWLHARLITAWLRQEKREGTRVERPPTTERGTSGQPGARGRGRKRRRASRRPGTPPPRRSPEPGADLPFDADGRLPRTPPPDWSDLVADEAAREHLAPAMEAAARHLPARLRIAWALCDVCGHDPVEAGNILDLSAVAVASRLHRARLILRAALERHVGQTAPATPTPAGDHL